MPFRTFMLLLLIAILSVDTYGFQIDEYTPTEMIVICHQPMYVPGDTVFFSVFANPANRERQIITIKVGRADSSFVHRRFILDAGKATGHFVIPPFIQAGQYTLGMLPESSDKELQWFSSDFMIFDKKNRLTDKEQVYKPEPIDLNFSNLEESYPIRSSVDVEFTVPLRPSAVKLVTVVCWNDEVFGEQNRSRNILQLLPTPSQQQRLYVDEQSSKNYFQGRALFNSGNPVPASSVVTFYLHRNDFIYKVKTEKNGYFTFPLFQEFGSEEVFYSISHNGVNLNDANLSLADYLLPSPAWNNGSFRSGNNPYGTYSYEREIIVDSYNHYLAKRSDDKTYRQEGDDWNADIVVEMSKYEPFKSMTDVFVNVVPMVRYKRTKTSEALRVFLQKSAMLATESPLFIIDGIMTDNFDYVMSLNPSLLKRVGVLRSEYSLARYGDLGAHGIILIDTSVPDHSRILPRTSRTIYVTGISSFGKASTNQFFNFSVNDKRVPDLRPVLYWYSGKPGDEVMKLKFTTSDDVGKYILQIYIADVYGVLRTTSTSFQVVAD